VRMGQELYLRCPLLADRIAHPGSLASPGKAVWLDLACVAAPRADKI
jgi:hypothetical protein